MADDTKDRTLWCGNLHGNVTEELLYELFIQAGPLEQVKIPMNDGKKKPFAFVTFRHVESVPYAMELMLGIALMGQQLRMQFRPGSIHETGGGGRGRPSGGYQQNQQNQNQRQLRHHGNNNMQQGGGIAGLMGSPIGMPANFNPLRPPMAGMLANTGFHRSFSSPDFYNNNPAGMMRQQSQGPDMFFGQGQQNEYNSNRDSPNSTPRHNQHRSEHEARAFGHERTRSHDRAHDRGHDRSHDRHSGAEPRDRKRRHQGDHGDRKHGQSRQGTDQSDVHKRASQNFKRQMASPPWQRSVPPWEQNPRH